MNRNCLSLLALSPLNSQFQTQVAKPNFRKSGSTRKTQSIPVQPQPSPLNRQFQAPLTKPKFKSISVAKIRFQWQDPSPSPSPSPSAPSQPSAPTPQPSPSPSPSPSTSPSPNPSSPAQIPKIRFQSENLVKTFPSKLFGTQTLNNFYKPETLNPKPLRPKP